MSLTKSKAWYHEHTGTDMYVDVCTLTHTHLVCHSANAKRMTIFLGFDWSNEVMQMCNEMLVLKLE